MHIFISGIGAGTGPLAVLAKQAGFMVSASDKQDNDYVDYVRKHGVNVHIGQTLEAIAAVHATEPIDWLVYSSAVAKENDNHPELMYAATNEIRLSKRDEFLQHFLEQTNQQMIAIAGTHGKSTTTAMAVWLAKQIGMPVSYLVGAKMPFAEAAAFDPNAQYFVYEADEYDRNFLSFSPAVSIIPGIAYDHPDIYPTQANYNEAFHKFIHQSDKTWLWKQDVDMLDLVPEGSVAVLHKPDYDWCAPKLIGDVNRQNAALVVQAFHDLDPSQDIQQLSDYMNTFPGVSRRFEQIVPNVYSDYAHTPEKIRGAIQIAQEISDNVVIVYEGLHNTRQHFIADQLPTLFTGTKKLYIVPTYRAREDETLEDLTPEKLCDMITTPADCQPMRLNHELKSAIQYHATNGDLVLCLTAGGGGSLDEWLRQKQEG